MNRDSERGRVLIVEDEVGVADVLDELLDLEGYECRQAVNGADALEILETYRPDVMLLDLNLPGLGGDDLVRRIRELPDPLATLPIIVITGAHGGLEAGAELGVVTAIRKPFALDEVLDAVTSAINGREGH